MKRFVKIAFVFVATAFVFSISEREAAAQTCQVFNSWPATNSGYGHVIPPMGYAFS